VIGLVKERYPGLYILPAFANLYADVPFRIPGDEHFYGRIDPNWNGDLLGPDFFNGGYEQNCLPFIRKVVSTFRDEPAIFAWEVGNELKLNPATGHPSIDDPHLNAFLTFMQKAAQEIRALDSNHLITTGLISTHHCWLHSDDLKRRIYGSGLFDFMTIHCYNHEYINDDSGLAQALNMPFIVEEAGFDTGFDHGDRARLIHDDMEYWYSRGARGYMQWGFMATPFDMGDGDGRSGMDKVLHNDWDTLFGKYRERANRVNSERQSVAVPQRPRPRPTKPIALEPGATVFAQTVLNVRQTPGGEILGQLAHGGAAQITATSTTHDGLVWWPLHATLSNGTTVNGWAAQSIPGQTLLSTAMPSRGLPSVLETLPVG
jgi:hypothetical protein